MNAKRLAQVEEICHAALELAPGTWPSFLTDSCGSDDDLRREVETLLSYSDVESALIDTPPMDIAAEFLQDANEPEIVGTTIDRYKILSKIGTGGMGNVYLAEDTKLERQVAIKFIKAEFAENADQLRRFVREAKTASSLNHPNIITVHEIGETEGVQFIATEYIGGDTLRQVLNENRLSYEELLGVAAQVATALSSAHEAGIFHRDIKPENIMLRSDGLVKVLDFGLAKLAEGASIGNGNLESTPFLTADDRIDPQSTSPGLLMGTAAYMSPEQARITAADARSDVWSLGVVMFEMFSGEKPFLGSTGREIIASILNDDPAILGDEVPRELQKVIYKAIRKNPADRYRSATALLFDIQGTRDRSSSTGNGIAASDTAVSSAEYFVNALKRHKIIVGASLILLLTISVSAFFYFGRGPVLSDKDTVLIADFQNLTDDADLSGTLNHGLALKLAQSPFLRILPESEIKDTLSVIGDGADKAITPEIAREICLRKNLKVFITGKFAPRGNDYLLTLQAVDVQTGGSIITEQTQVESKDQVLNALDKPVANLREKLGESLSSIRKFDVQTEVATTSSLEAMRAYSMAMESYAKGGNKDEAVLSLFQLAIKLDPTFALAYRDLARHQHNIGRFADAAVSITKAFELRERTSENEKMSIEVLYYEFATHDLGKAADTAELWKNTFPRLWHPYHALADIYFESGQYERSIENGREAIRLNPNFAAAYTNPAGALFRLDRFAEAKDIYQQAMANDLDHLAYHFFLFWIGYFENDPPLARQQIDWMATHDYRHFAFAYETQMAMIEGRWKQSIEFSMLARSESVKYGEKNLADQVFVWEALNGALFGDCRTSKQRSEEILQLSDSSNVLADAAFSLAICGDDVRAQKIADGLAARTPKNKALDELWLPTVRAAIELDRNRPEKALELLVPAEEYQGSYVKYAPFVKGMALMRLGRVLEAAAKFRKVHEHPGSYENTPLVPLSHLWEARALALSGDRDRSRQAYENFFTLWKDADADLPILLDAKREYRSLK